MERKFKRTKIIATVGPASRSKEMLLKLHEAGADIFRMNFSHGEHEDHQKVIDWVRELNKEHNTNICLLQDLQGPKIRTNQIENNAVEIKPGNQIQIVADDFVGNAEKISTTYKTIAKDVKAGDCILIDDGNLELKVLNSDGQTVTAEVVHGGMLKSRKGINLPNTAISEPCLTEKDLKDLEFGLEQDVDWVALSFVRSEQDIKDINKRIKASGKNVKVIAKIEKPEAIDNIDAIIEETDAIMVARGDLGVEVDMAKVPMIQKDLVEKCNAASKPCIIATQMMESMITNPRPTRAEANDVANAITDGADTVMLSAESAAGDYPVQAVSSMTRIIQEVEQNSNKIYNKFFPLNPEADTKLSDSLIFSVGRIAEYSHAKAIICMTESGYTAMQLSRLRPTAKIFAFTSDEKLLTRLNLVWGVTAFHYEKHGTSEETIEDVKNFLKNKGVVDVGDIIVNTLSMPLWRNSHTNTLKISVVD